MRRTAMARLAAAASIAACLGGCTFGTLSARKCLEHYGPGAAAADAAARSSGTVVKEAYSYCADGRARIEAAIPPLRAHGFAPSQPNKHFEVPGGWCVGASRPVPAGGFDAMRSLDTICAIGDASQAYFTGGALTSSDGKAHSILSIYDREAREALNRRLEQNRR